MDKPRTNKPKKKGPWYIAGAIVGAALITLGLSRLKPAPPSVDKAAVWTDTVRRGEMVRAVRGPGTLVPVNIQLIPAVTAGRVEEIFLRPGASVKPGTELLRLSNPDVELQLLEAERQLNQAQAQLVSLRATLQTQRLAQEASVATIQSQYNDAARQQKVNDQLIEKGLIDRNTYEQQKDQFEELQKRLGIEQKRLEVQANSIDAQIEGQQAQVKQITEIVRARKEQLASMDVTSPTEGVLQQLDLQPGEWVNSGTLLARVVQPGQLKAVLRIPETQAKDVVIGQKAKIDTRNGIAPGHVVRIDPAALQGTVGVDVAFDGPLPAGARPDLSVDGTIEIDRLPNVLYVSRPGYGSAGSTIGVFKLEPGGKEAVRVNVKLGQASVNLVEIENGLKEGDVILLNDMSAYDAYPRVRIR